MLSALVTEDRKFDTRLSRFMNVLHPELNFCGFLVPLNMAAGVIGFLTAWLTVDVLERLRLTRYVGNVSLFFIALAILLAGLTDWLVNLS
jgi:hypothetical protein